MSQARALPSGTRWVKRVTERITPPRILNTMGRPFSISPKVRRRPQEAKLSTWTMRS